MMEEVMSQQNLKLISTGNFIMSLIHKGIMLTDCTIQYSKGILYLDNFD